MSEQVQGNNKLKIILFCSISIAIILLIIIAIIFITKDNNGNVESELDKILTSKEYEIRNEAYKIYQSNGKEPVIALYDKYINGTSNTDEKIKYLKYRISALDAFCEWECSEQILSDVHTIHDLDNSETTTSELCVYEYMYNDENPLEQCNGDFR
ncbi:hypothetical protein IKG33_01520 [Candidatus Saccharibacteria bacterium]|nr:hypothetical protein [Candidatus Saccharibacteria bacterium]